MVIAINEFCNLVHISKIAPFCIGILLFYLFTFGKLENKWLTNSSLGITILISIKAIVYLFSKKNNTISTLEKYLFLLGYIILSFIFITKIPFGINGYNPKIIIGIFILIWTNDTFAYIIGKSLGKNKLFQRISPKKTIEGFIGGLVFCIFTSLLIAKYFIGSNNINTIYIWIGIAFITSIFGTIGDLIESKFKRVANVKDSGNIMPGHGGVLDRLDSIIFVAPFVYLFYQILNYVS
jgi:phosphatidate cytidylyltransferase